MKREVILFAILTICILVLSGCGHNNSSTEQEKEFEEKKIQIGLSMDSFILERWQRERDIFLSEAQNLGAEVNVQNASGDVNEQIAQIEYLISKKMDVLVIIPVEAGTLTEVVKKAKREGIKVIAYDRMINNANVDLYLSFDNKKIGELMAKNLIKNVPSNANVLMLGGPLTDSNVIEVTEGFKEVIEKSSLNLISKHHLAEWIPEKAFIITNQCLDLAYKIDGIMCGNDAFAGQAIKALAEKRLAGKVYVVGQDADIEACQRIVEGTQTMTVYKPVHQLAKKGVEYALALVKGEEIQVLDTIFDGSFNVPYAKLECIAVTKENMNEVIIEGGFHSKEDVYLNIPQ